jgi:hypothetical protein
MHEFGARQQHREERALLATTEWKRPRAADRFERTEDPELHLAPPGAGSAPRR